MGIKGRMPSGGLLTTKPHGSSCLYHTVGQRRGCVKHSHCNYCPRYGRANKGLVPETSRQLASAPYNYGVLMTSHEPGRAETAAVSLREGRLSAKHIALDVTDNESITAASKASRRKVRVHGRSCQQCRHSRGTCG